MTFALTKAAHAGVPRSTGMDAWDPRQEARDKLRVPRLLVVRGRDCMALVVPDEHKLGERPPTEIAKTLAGLARRVVQRLLALTLGMFINSLLGRPPRALAAYDGR